MRSSKRSLAIERSVEEKLNKFFYGNRAVAPILYAHLFLQIEYILETNIDLKREIMLELYTKDREFIGFLCATFPKVTRDKRKNGLFDFGVGHTEEDLEKWEEKYWQQ